MTRLRKLTAAVTLTGLLATGCSTARGASETAGPAPNPEGPCAGRTVNVAQAGTGYPRLPMYVALYGGFLARTGLEVKVAETDAGADAAAALIGGSADVSPGTYSDVLLAQAGEADLVAFAASGYQEIANVVMKKSVMRKLGITAKSSAREKVKALRGLRIGVTSPGSSTELLARGILAAAGMDPDTDASVTPVGMSAMASVFSNDQVDAFVLSSPSADAAAEVGGGEVVLDFAGRDYPQLDGALSMTFNTTPQTAKRKTKELSCFTTAMNRALKLMRAEPDRAKEYAWKQFDGSVDRKQYDATIDTSMASFANDTTIDKKEAKRRIDFIGAVRGSVADLDVADTYIALPQ